MKFTEPMLPERTAFNLRRRISCKLAVLLAVLQHFGEPAHAQMDSAYYTSYAEQITGRFYFSRKYTALQLNDAGRGVDLDYQPNTTLNAGIGATYRNFTLNLAYGFPFLNRDEGRGNTQYLDLQGHFYGQRATIDLFGQFYNGFYLSPRGKGRNDGQFYLRPDLQLREFGASYQYLFNHRKFSYRAAFLQNEWQRKSAGTFLLGGEFFFGRASADSSIYPRLISPTGAPTATALRFFEFGPNFGYAYTLVIAQHFFITGSLCLSMDYNFTEYEDGDRSYGEKGLSPNSIFRLFAGYNSARNAFSFTFTNSRVSLSSGETNSVSISTGNVRLNYVRRFETGPKAKRWLKVLDRRKE